MNSGIIVIIFVLIIIFYTICLNKRKISNFKNNNIKKYPKRKLKNKKIPIKKYSDKYSHVDVIYKKSKLLETVKSEYQTIEIYDDDFFGYLLVIDDDIQITENDQYIYHEMIVNFPLNYNHNGKKVLVIGGGDCGTVTEICKYDNIDEIIWVEIDKEVIKICEKYFPELSKGKYDKRTTLVIDDGAKWVRDNLNKYSNYFDFIIIDSSDYTAALTLFTEEFYTNISKLLSENGILNLNYGSLLWDNFEYMDENIILKNIYKYVDFYKCNIPTYASGGYLFCFCSNKINVRNTPIEDKSIDTKYYNNKIHKSSLVLLNHYDKYVINNNEETRSLGMLYTVDIKNANSKLLDDINKLDILLEEIVKKYNLTILSTQKKKFNPIGVTILKLLSESHISIHTWPEYNKCSIDLFTCGKFNWTYNEKDNMIQYLMRFFDISENDIKFNYIDRRI